MPILYGFVDETGKQSDHPLVTDTGELSQRRLLHREEAEQFYRELREQGLKARVGMESSGHSRWFERLLRELQFELWIGCRRGDPHEASAQAEDRSPGCAAVTTVDDGAPLSADLGARRRQSRSAAVVVASASFGADAHASDEPVACGGTQRRLAPQEGAVAAGGPQGAGVHRAGAVGQPTAARPARLARSADS